jgi:hypothetical protein
MVFCLSSLRFVFIFMYAFHFSLGFNQYWSVRPGRFPQNLPSGSTNPLFFYKVSLQSLLIHVFSQSQILVLSQRIVLAQESACCGQLVPRFKYVLPQLATAINSSILLNRFWNSTQVGPVTSKSIIQWQTDVKHRYHKTGVYCHLHIFFTLPQRVHIISTHIAWRQSEERLNWLRLTLLTCSWQGTRFEYRLAHRSSFGFSWLSSAVHTNIGLVP